MMPQDHLPMLSKPAPCISKLDPHSALSVQSSYTMSGLDAVVGSLLDIMTEMKASHIHIMCDQFPYIRVSGTCQVSKVAPAAAHTQHSSQHPSATTTSVSSGVGITTASHALPGGCCSPKHILEGFDTVATNKSLSHLSALGLVASLSQSTTVNITPTSGSVTYAGHHLSDTQRQETHPAASGTTYITAPLRGFTVKATAPQPSSHPTTSNKNPATSLRVTFEEQRTPTSSVLSTSAPPPTLFKEARCKDTIQCEVTIAVHGLYYKLPVRSSAISNPLNERKVANAIAFAVYSRVVAQCGRCSVTLQHTRDTILVSKSATPADVINIFFGINTKQLSLQREQGEHLQHTAAPKDQQAPQGIRPDHSAVREELELLVYNPPSLHDEHNHDDFLTDDTDGPHDTKTYQQRFARPSVVAPSAKHPSTAGFGSNPSTATVPKPVIIICDTISGYQRVLPLDHELLGFFPAFSAGSTGGSRSTCGSSVLVAVWKTNKHSLLQRTALCTKLVRPPSRRKFERALAKVTSADTCDDLIPTMQNFREHLCRFSGVVNVKQSRDLSFHQFKQGAATSTKRGDASSFGLSPASQQPFKCDLLAMSDPTPLGIAGTSTTWSKHLGGTYVPIQEDITPKPVGLLQKAAATDTGKWLPPWKRKQVEVAEERLAKERAHRQASATTTPQQASLITTPKQATALNLQSMFGRYFHKKEIMRVENAFSKPPQKGHHHNHHHAKSGGNQREVDLCHIQQFRVVAQWEKKFIICIISDGRLVCFDQHAVHERMRVESFFANIATFLDPTPMVLARDGNDAQEGASAPTAQSNTKQFSLRGVLLELACRFHKQLNFWGWRFQQPLFDTLVKATGRHPAGGQQDAACKVTACPSMTIEGISCVLDSLAHLEETLFDLERIGSSATRIVDGHSAYSVDAPPAYTPAPLIRFAISRSCRGAIMFGDHLSLSACRKLISSLQTVTQFDVCSHGRPSLSVICPASATACSAPTSNSCCHSKPLSATFGSLGPCNSEHRLPPRLEVL